MFENILNIFKKNKKIEGEVINKAKAKERLHLVLMQDRANVSADFLDMMKQEIIEVIKKYIDVDEDTIEVKLINKPSADGTTGAPALYANIPILNIKKETRINANAKKLNEMSDGSAVNKAEKAQVEEKKAEPTKTKTIKKNTNNVNKNGNNKNKKLTAESKKAAIAKAKKANVKKVEVVKKEETIQQNQEPVKENQEVKVQNNNIDTANKTEEKKG